MMMLLLPFHILQQSVELAGTHRKHAISALPEKSATENVKRFALAIGFYSNPVTLPQAVIECRAIGAKQIRKLVLMTVRSTAEAFSGTKEIAAACKILDDRGKWSSRLSILSSRRLRKFEIRAITRRARRETR
jgi:hypothetical protein